MKSLQGLGIWLGRKWLNCQKKKQEAQTQLDKLPVDKNLLRMEWAAQINEQTKPLARRSANLANKIIEEILVLKSKLDSAKDDLKDLQDILESGDYGIDTSVMDINMQMDELEGVCMRLRNTIAKKKKTLDVDEHLNLAKLLNNKFLQLRVNALALKKRIRARLCQRKFELEGLERAFRGKANKANGM
jgi:hypothetical protein